jgi:hypothetical protein
MDPSASSDAAAAAAATLWGGMFSAMCCFAYLIPIGLGMASMVLWIITLVDVAQRKDAEFPNAAKGAPNGNDRIVWLLVVLLAGFIGAIIYYFVVMRPYPRSREAA